MIEEDEIQVPFQWKEGQTKIRFGSGLHQKPNLMKSENEIGRKMESSSIFKRKM